MNSKDFTNRLPLIPETYRKQGIYSSRNMNELGRVLNNFESGDGISITRNTTSGYKISLEHPFHPFRIYGGKDQDASFSYPSVKVYAGTWTRNGLPMGTVVNTGKLYKTITFSDGDGSFVIFAELNDSMNPSTVLPARTLNLYYTTSDLYYNVLNYSDVQDRRLKIGTVRILNGQITSISQNQLQDEDDISIQLPFQTYDFVGTASVASMKIRGGAWYYGNTYVTMATQLVALASTGIYYIYVEKDSNYEPATLIPYASLTPPAVTGNLKRLIAVITVADVESLRTMTSHTQHWTGDIHQGIATIVYQNRYYKVDHYYPGVEGTDYELAPAGGFGQEGDTNTGFLLEPGRFWHSEHFVNTTITPGTTTLINAKFQRCLPV